MLNIGKWTIFFSCWYSDVVKLHFRNIPDIFKEMITSLHTQHKLQLQIIQLTFINEIAFNSIQFLPLPFDHEEASSGESNMYWCRSWCLNKNSTHESNGVKWIAVTVLIWQLIWFLIFAFCFWHNFGSQSVRPHRNPFFRRLYFLSGSAVTDTSQTGMTWIDNIYFGKFQFSIHLALIIGYTRPEHELSIA